MQYNGCGIMTEEEDKNKTLNKVLQARLGVVVENKIKLTDHLLGEELQPGWEVQNLIFPSQVIKF